MTGTALTLWFPNVLPNLALNDNQKRREYWATNHGIARDERLAWRLLILGHPELPRAHGEGIWKGAYPVAVLWTVQYPDRRKRDPDGILAALKPSLDGVVDSGLIPGDDCSVIAEYGVRVILRSKEPGMWLEIRSLEAKHG